MAATPRAVAGAMKASLRQIWLGSGTLGALTQTVVIKVFILGMNVATGVICARNLGPEGRGLLGALIMWPNLIAALATFGIPHSQLYHMRSDRAKSDGVFTAAMLLIVPAGCLAALVAAFSMPFLLAGHRIEDIRFAQAIMLVTPLVSLSMVLQTGAEAMHDFFGANTLRAGTVLLVFVSLLMLQVSGSVTPYLAALCYSLSFLPVTAWLAIRLWRVMPPTLNGIRGSLRVVSHYAFRCYPLDLIGTSAFYASQVAVVTLLDPAIVGLFFVAFGVARIMEVTYTAVATVLLPKTAGLGSAEVVEKTMRAARLNLLGSIPITLILILLAGFLLPLLYGDDFAAAVLLARVMLVEALVTGTTSILAQAFLALGRPRIPTLLNIIGLAASIIGMVMLVPSLGAMGVVVTMLLVACLKLATIVTSYRKLLGVPLRRFLIQREDMDFLRRLSGRLRPGTTR